MGNSNPYPKFKHPFPPPSGYSFSEYVRQCGDNSNVGRLFDMRYRDVVVEWNVLITKIDIKKKMLKLLISPSEASYTNSEATLQLTCTNPKDVVVFKEHTFRMRIKKLGGRIYNHSFEEVDSSFFVDHTLSYEKFLFLFGVQAQNATEKYFSKYWVKVKLRIRGVCLKVVNNDAIYEQLMREYRKQISENQREKKKVESRGEVYIDIPPMHPVKPDYHSQFEFIPMEVIPKEVEPITCVMKISYGRAMMTKEIESLTSSNEICVVACCLSCSDHSFEIESWSFSVPSSSSPPSTSTSSCPSFPFSLPYAVSPSSSSYPSSSLYSKVPPPYTSSTSSSSYPQPPPSSSSPSSSSYTSIPPPLQPLSAPYVFPTAQQKMPSCGPPNDYVSSTTQTYPIPLPSPPSQMSIPSPPNDYAYSSQPCSFSQSYPPPPSQQSQPPPPPPSSSSFQTTTVTTTNNTSFPQSLSCVDYPTLVHVQSFPPPPAAFQRVDGNNNSDDGMGGGGGRGGGGGGNSR